MEEEKVLSYLKEIFRNKDRVFQNIYAAFVYGNPDGKDIDLCIICDLPWKLPKPPEFVDLKAYSPNEFPKILKEHGKDAKEFRVIALEYLMPPGQQNGIRCWPDRREYVENMVMCADTELCLDSKKKGAEYKPLEIRVTDFSGARSYEK